MPTDIPKDLTPTEQKKRQPKPGSGNRCGHDPEAPRWFTPPDDHKQRPKVIQTWIERVRQFYQTPSRIPTLAAARHTRAMLDDPSATSKPRKMRSERREACCDLLAAMAHYCDLPTLCLSVPQPDGSMLPVRMDTLAEKAGLSLRRAERAMRDIATSALVSIHERCEFKDGEYKGRAAIRAIPKEFFGLFGLESRLAHDRQKISKKRRENGVQQPETRTGKARVSVAIKQAVGAVRNKPIRAEAAPPAKPARERPASMSEALGVIGGMLGTGPEDSYNQDKRAASIKRAQDEAGDSRPERKGKHDPP